MKTQDASTFGCGKEVMHVMFLTSSIVQAILEDQPPPVAPRKYSTAEMTTGKALPNTYVKIEESARKGESPSVYCITVTLTTPKETSDASLLNIAMSSKAKPIIFSNFLILSVRFKLI